MKQKLTQIEECLEALKQHLKEIESIDVSFLKQQFENLSELSADRSLTPIADVAASVLHGFTDVVEYKKLTQAIRCITVMLNNLQNGTAHLNEKLQQEFFKKWLVKKTTTRFEDEDDVEEISSVDFLEEGEDDIEQFFAIEAKDTVDKIRYFVDGLRSEKHWQTALTQLRASTHTLKGSAAIVGDKVISGLAHQFEEVLVFSKRPKAVYIELMVQVCDTLKWLASNLTLDENERNERASSASRLLEEFRTSRKVVPQQLDFIDGGDVLPLTAARISSSGVALDKLALLMEESDTARSMLMEDVRQIRAISQNLKRSVSGLEDYLEEEQLVEESSVSKRSLAKLPGGDARTSGSRLREVFSDFEEYFRLLEQRVEGCHEGLDKVEEVSSRVWREIARSKRIPVGRMFGILQKIVKELSQKQGIEAHLVTQGGDIQVEKKVFETLFDPIVQLIRNAVSHGLETPKERMRANKTASGKITLSFENQGDDLVIGFDDDGRGIDTQLLQSRVKSESRQTHDIGNPAELIFVSGVTTRDAISEVAGRGIGMDVVTTALAKLNGMVQLTTSAGECTRFAVRIPSSLFYTTVHVVRAMGHLFAIPSALVHSGREDIFFTSSDYPMLSLREVLGSTKSKRPSLLVGAVEKRFYLEVDEVITEQPAVLVKLGRFFKNLIPVWGATLMRQGDMAFVLNLRELYNIASKRSRLPRATTTKKREQPSKGSHILAVDDSISVREHLKRTLAKYGYTVDVASDGSEAMQLLKKQSYDLVITDLEMPIVDGFELIESIQAMDNGHKTTCMIITSRVGAEEKKRAASYGVATFLAKPFDETDLLNSVRRLLAH